MPYACLMVPDLRDGANHQQDVVLALKGSTLQKVVGAIGSGAPGLLWRCKFCAFGLPSLPVA